MALKSNMRCIWLALVMLLTGALAATSYSHSAPSLQEQRLQSYLTAGGAMADICGMEGMGGSGDMCPLCRLSDHVMAPAGPSETALALKLSTELGLTPAEPATVRAKARDPSRMMRGPPLA